MCPWAKRRTGLLLQLNLRQNGFPSRDWRKACFFRWCPSISEGGIDIDFTWTENEIIFRVRWWLS